MTKKKWKFSDSIEQTGYERAENIAQEYAKAQGYEWNEGTSVIFQASSINDYSPEFQGKAIKSHHDIIRKWVDKHFKDFANRPSKRSSPPPRTKHDPALDMILKGRLPHLSAEDLENIKWAHRMAMSAENIFGMILEEYLANNLEKHGWYCAWGAVVNKVDFVSNTDGMQFLQVKSRSNTENSSSTAGREGANKQKVWKRFHSIKGTTNWQELNEIANITGEERLTEEKFTAFVQNLINNNPNALAMDTENSWQTNHPQG